MKNKLQQWLRLPGSKKPNRLYRLFQIEPTLQCGLSCVMCPWSEMRTTAGTMTWETFAHIARHLPQAKSVDLTGGGEPTLSPHLVEMVRLAKEAGCEVGFSTNAVRLTPELSEKLVGLGLDWISFSVDAATASLYERIRQGAKFDTLIGNIRALQSIKKSRNLDAPRMMMVFVMMGAGQPESANFHELPQFIDLAHSLGVEQVIAKNLDVIIKDGDDQRRLFQHDGGSAAQTADVKTALAQAQARARKLGVGLRTYLLQPEEQTICEHDPLHNLFFDWQGNVSPCITLSYAEERFFAGERVHVPCQRFGNINLQTLDDIWSSPAYREFRKAYELRLSWERQALVDAMLTISQNADGQNYPLRERPAAPEGCRTCYYLYGI
jgi:MoaA/NifB/PqqE/SkfB family radical SAM enzyme